MKEAASNIFIEDVVFLDFFIIDENTEVDGLTVRLMSIKKPEHGTVLVQATDTFPE